MTNQTPTDAPETATQKPAPKGTPKGGMSWGRFLSDIVPAIVFFIAYRWANKHGVPASFVPILGNQPVLFATIAFVPVALLGFAFSWVKEKSISPIGAFSMAMILVFSGLAVWLKNDIFIKMRPTLIYAIMGLLLLASVWFKRNLLKSLFGGAMHLPEDKWTGLTQRAAIMYLSLAAINEIVWRTLPEATWVTYNTWGDMAINFAFWIINIIILAPFMMDEDGNKLIEKED